MLCSAGIEQFNTSIQHAIAAFDNNSAVQCSIYFGCLNGGSCDYETGRCNCKEKFEGPFCQFLKEAPPSETFEALCDARTDTNGAGGAEGVYRELTPSARQRALRSAKSKVEGLSADPSRPSIDDLPENTTTVFRLGVWERIAQAENIATSTITAVSVNPFLGSTSWVPVAKENGKVAFDLQVHSMFPDLRAWVSSRKEKKEEQSCFVDTDDTDITLRLVLYYCLQITFLSV